MAKGFSLLEVMVVVAIIGLLAAIAAPLYASYLDRTRISEAVEILNTLNAAALQAYNEQALSAPFVYDGYSLAEGTATLVAYPPVEKIIFYSPQSSLLGATNEWMFCAQLGALKLSGFSDPISGTAQYSTLCSKMKEVSGAYTNFCGNWDGSTIYIPVEQLPSSCNCASVSTESC